ncbi:hypothetical protein L202_07550 [Cryptococcus amylolentus CBS 6039]|uniref:Uncharacterized protein n=1 Tax=Cryptococcus amylolentus CBS 6039 TaxID=1295533 RepID=A0A1E3HCL7_9TREE|nr:hypothetical protein L202_07550 [Cryptococcus amylolentus CBS 6039]ODN74088.1 hypothetical protein L202_07550 [Cryptococcus amylolentus CBS 6039]
MSSQPKMLPLCTLPSVHGYDRPHQPCRYHACGGCRRAPPRPGTTDFRKPRLYRRRTHARMLGLARRRYARWDWDWLDTSPSPGRAEDRKVAHESLPSGRGKAGGGEWSYMGFRGVNWSPQRPQTRSLRICSRPGRRKAPSMQRKELKSTGRIVV